MKKMLIALILLLTTSWPCHSQIIKELFNQASTQKKYLIEQIAALKVYTEALQKGYEIAKDGLNLIADIKNKDLDLHKDYFTWLKKVKPVIKLAPRTQGIIAQYYRIVTVCHQSKKQVMQTGMLTSEEYRYYEGVMDKVESASTYLMQELGTVTTDGDWAMKDDDRIDRIENLALSMEDNYTFCKGFSAQVMVMATSRQRDQESGEIMKAVNGLK
jgi:hypothetical protein